VVGDARCALHGQGCAWYGIHGNRGLGAALGGYAMVVVAPN
jgi:hypothetical protein